MLENKIDHLVKKVGRKNIKLYVHPYVEAYINKGFWSLKRRWQFRYGFGVKIIPSQELAFLEYRFYDNKGECIDMKEESDAI